MPEAGIVESPVAASAPAMDTNIDAPLKGSPGQPVPQRDRLANLMKHAKPASSLETVVNEAPDKAKTQSAKIAGKEDGKLKTEDAPAPDEDIVRPGKLDATETDKSKQDIEPLTEKTSNQKAFKLANHYRAENLKLVKQISELKKAQPIGDDPEKKELSDKLIAHQKEMENLRKEKKDVDDLLRFRDYQNHPEFQQEYVQPLDVEWSKSMRRLKGLKYADAAGNELELSKRAIQELSELEPDVARDKIFEMFPDVRHYNAVITSVEDIHDLTEKYKTGLQKAWSDSDKWQKDKHAQEQEQINGQNKVLKTVHEENAAIFNNFNKADLAEVEYLKEKEGDDEWNTRLEKANAEAKAALNSNPNNPALSRDDRTKMIRRNTKIVNWAISAPMLNLKVTRLESELSKKNKIIAGYEGSEPRPGSGKGRTAVAVPADPSAARESRLMKYVG